MTEYAQIYCTVGQMIDDLRQGGEKPGLLERIEQASAFVRNEIGDFLPVTESRTYIPDQNREILKIDPVLAVTEITVDGTTLTSADYRLLPVNKHWRNGPCTYIQRIDAAWEADSTIILTGRFGMYELTGSTGLTGTLAAADTATLALTNGSILSPGMVILIETEQLLVTAGNGGQNSPATTAATSLTAEAIAVGDEEFNVDNGSEFRTGEVIRIGSEDMRILRITSNTLTVARGWNQTVRAAHNDDSAIGVYRTYSVIRGVNGTTAAAHSAKTIYKYTIPGDVAWLTRQIAGLMQMKTETGFSGRAGNTELGEVFYINEFPRHQIKEVKLHYRLWA